MNYRDTFVDKFLNFESVETRIERLLKLGEQYDATFTFYITAGNISGRNEHIVEEIAAHGHEIGSHSYAHLNFGDIDETRARRQIKRSLDVLNEYYPVKGFRAPYLVGNKATERACRSLGLTYSSSNPGKQPRCDDGFWTVPVTKPQDGEVVHRTNFSTGHVRSEWIDFVGSGEVLLFHPWRIGAKKYIDTFEQLLRADCEFGSVSEFISDQSLCCLTFDLDFLSWWQVYPHTLKHLFRSPHLDRDGL